MKVLSIFLFFVLFSVGTGCNSSSSETSQSRENKPSCASKKCSSSKTESSCSSSQFDANMSKVCQQACGVSEYDESDVVDAIEAKVGEITKCPVSGAVYKVKVNSPDLEHDGKSFHSCCQTCALIFEDNPEKFVKNL